MSRQPRYKIQTRRCRNRHISRKLLTPGERGAIVGHVVEVADVGGCTADEEVAVECGGEGSEGGWKKRWFVLVGGRGLVGD